MMGVAATSLIFEATNEQLSLRGCTNMSSGTPRACANVGGTPRHATSTVPHE